jgi:hypothetical protein
LTPTFGASWVLNNAARQNEGLASVSPELAHGQVSIAVLSIVERRSTLAPMIIQSAVTEVKQQHTTVKLYWAGFDAYMNGQPLEEMTRGERHGWLAAQRAQADCETAGYLAKVSR